MFCGLNQENYHTLDMTNTVKNFLKDIWTDLKQFFSMEEYEWFGVVDKVELIRDPETNLPLIDDGTCFHELTLKDGTIFHLDFPQLTFTSLQPRLQPGYAVKIKYQIPPNHQPKQVINIYPRPYYKITSYENFMDENSSEITDESLVKIHYLEDQITRIDFLENEKPKLD